ncbi:thiamine pyrophosphate-dependent dehydrogenase E1 component subunit alpha [Kribbella sandramycini]|uniref:2-oxoisovalerate dehydrogenase subunit alpha n=1 Tax=Kribbella sandramycini TaxID=60450 RepID=A0A7Y4KZ46_9ACTN|nr:thiamine pyrophosphate-dependent dehydrogenase E1 component subunit alpha [Kribbella sandramycini]MBB6565063.1 pyruvate dehydrogenase E1 component alpha subunit [Kribbella sandramycini]NOL41335.1 thiamine pyrophosphate-dependent dehydrogenase E1 component subunit alpha [Kribbella sandramycini]
MTTVEERLLPSAEPVRLIDQDGVPHEHPSYQLPSEQALADGYVELIKGRRINDQASALVRQGRLAVYPSSHGQEACQVAATMVLRDGDWLFPTYRDTVSIVSRGVDPIETLTLLRGDWHSGYDPYARNVAPQATPLATQLTHAVGVAHAARLKGEDTVVMALCGDGATSEGDFHEALNFAAVFHAPVVFFVQNNEYAISVPLSKQTVAPSLAHKGIGYGVPGERADGNDLAGLLAILGQAVGKARAGEGPQLVEAHTYRVQAHTNADDATRYREDDEVTPWLQRDPIKRLETYLTHNGLLTDELKQRAEQVSTQVAQQLRDGLMPEPTVNPEDLFAYLYAEQTPQLAEQAAFLRDELSREEA